MRERASGFGPRLALTLSFAAMAVPAVASASELVFEPINPSFGGPSLNSGHLLSLAEIQNQHRPEPQSRSSATELTPEQEQAERFVRSLQSRLLSALASETVEAIFGENPQESGEVVFGEQTISFQRDLEQVQISIFDANTGSTTDIAVPVLQTTE